MTFLERLDLVEDLIEGIMNRKNHLTSYEQGFMDAIIEIPHPDYVSDANLAYLQELNERLKNE